MFGAPSYRAQWWHPCWAGVICTRGVPDCAANERRPSAAYADLRGGPRANAAARRTDSLARPEPARRLVDLRHGTREAGHRSLIPRPTPSKVPRVGRLSMYECCVARAVQHISWHTHATHHPLTEGVRPWVRQRTSSARSAPSREWVGSRSSQSGQARTSSRCRRTRPSPSPGCPARSPIGRAGRLVPDVGSAPPPAVRPGPSSRMNRPNDTPRSQHLAQRQSR
jgi:hypothetical protein